MVGPFSAQIGLRLIDQAWYVGQRGIPLWHPFFALLIRPLKRYFAIFGTGLRLFLKEVGVAKAIITRYVVVRVLYESVQYC